MIQSRGMQTSILFVFGMFGMSVRPSMAKTGFIFFEDPQIESDNLFRYYVQYILYNIRYFSDMTIFEIFRHGTFHVLNRI